MASRSIAEIADDWIAEQASAVTVGDDLRDKLRKSLFTKQLEFLNDKRFPKKGACCGRRGGKTQLEIRGGLIEPCLEKPRSVCVYFATTLASARKLVWDCPDGIPVLIKDMGIDAVCEVNESDHRVTFSNGSVLWVTGCETLPDARRWKGLRYDRAVVDEGQDWPEEILAYLINEALNWALMDRRGELWLMGTPSPYFGGIFYEIMSGIRPGWGLHHWTCFDNPHIPDPQAFIEMECAERGLTLEDPIVQREFFGRWVRDSNTLLFHYQPGRNDYESLPQEAAWRYTLGMDIGLRDLTTYNLAAFRPYDRCVYFLHSFGERAEETTAPITRFAEVIRGYQQRLGPGLRLVADVGAIALSYQLELRNRFNINIDAAKKTEKASAIRFMNDQFRLGNIKLGKECEPLRKQLMTLQVDPKTQIEKPTQACDFADGALYAWRDCWAYLAGPAPDPSPDAERARMVQRVIGQRLRQNHPEADAERRTMTIGAFNEQL